MPQLVPDPVWLAHVGGELGTGHLIVLAVIGIVGNSLLLAPRAFGLFVKGPLSRALREATGPDARIGAITLPLRGAALTVGEVEIPGLPEITRVEAEVDLLGLRRDPVTIPRIVVIRPPGLDAWAGGDEGRRLESPSSPPSAAGDPGSPGASKGDGAAEPRRYDVGTIVIRSGCSDEEESDGSEERTEGPETLVDGPGSPTDLEGLVRHLVREVRAAQGDSHPGR